MLKKFDFEVEQHKMVPLPIHPLSNADLRRTEQAAGVFESKLSFMSIHFPFVEPGI